MLHRPHHVDPSPEKIRVALFYKNFAARAGVSHIGLGVSLHNTMLTLRKYGIWAEVIPLVNPQDAKKILEDRQRSAERHNPPIPQYSHAVFSAPWVSASEFADLANCFPNINFVSLCHSNVGFLQFDTRGVRNIRDYMDLEHGSHNFHLAGNNTRFTEWIHKAYRAPCAYLPNLYHLKRQCPHNKPPWDGSILRIGCFGAIRPQKNLMSAVGAALAMAGTANADTEIWISSGRPENSGVIVKSVHEMVDGLPGVKLVDNGWQSWPAFLRTVRHMDILLQPSYTETFNIVTADGVDQGVPSVVGEAIEWAPKSWMADVDDTMELARKGMHLLRDPMAVLDGWSALAHYVERGVHAWKAFLEKH